MALREGARLNGDTVDLAGLTDPDAAGAAGVPHAELLTRFADALVQRDDAALTAARRALVEAVGPHCTVDAAGVASNFQRMVRIADATGIELDAPMQVMSDDLREDLGINGYVAAANTREVRGFKRWLMKRVAVPMMRRVMRRESRLRGH